MKDHNETILITGHTGFLGSIFWAELKGRYNLIEFLSKDQTRIDITESFEWYHPVDIIIHAAGKAHSVPRTKEEEKAFYDVNYNGTVHLCEALDELEPKPKAFIFISTVSVYGVDSGEMIDEQHPLHGTTPYAKSKILAEEYLNTWANKNQVKLSILRLPLIAGPNPPGNLGSMIKGIKTGKYLSIGKADTRKSIVWASDIANHIKPLSEVGGTYNLSDRHNPTIHEIEMEIVRNLKRKTPSKIPLWAARLLGKIGDVIGDKSPVNSLKIRKLISQLTFDDNKAVENIGWKPTQVLPKIKDII